MITSSTLDAVNEGRGAILHPLCIDAPDMTAEFYAFGEILQDCLSSGRHTGGAAFNVTAHLVQLGGSASLLSAAGNDEFGDEILQVAKDKGGNTGFFGRHPELPTGTVRATVHSISPTPPPPTST